MPPGARPLACLWPLQIAARELRLVQVHRVEAPGVGQPATFQLLRRPRDSIIPQVVGSGLGGSPKAAPPPAGGSPGKGRQPAGKPARSAAGVDPAGKRAWGGAAGSGGGAPGPERLGSAAGVAAGASAANRFCKFTLVGEATPLFVAEAKRLAQHAAQVGRLPAGTVVAAAAIRAWPWPMANAGG